jgi:hypothetical protein
MHLAGGNNFCALPLTGSKGRNESEIMAAYVRFVATSGRRSLLGRYRVRKERSVAKSPY